MTEKLTAQQYNNNIMHEIGFYFHSRVNRMMAYYTYIIYYKHVIMMVLHTRSRQLKLYYSCLGNFQSISRLHIYFVYKYTLI